MKPSAKRGDVWWADLEGDKVRPVVVLTRDPLGRVLSSLICAPLTTRDRGLASQVRLGVEHGLPNECVANLINVTLVARERLLRRLTTLDASTMAQVCESLGYATGCGR